MLSARKKNRNKTDPTPTDMQAVVIEQFGALDVLRVKTVAVPQPSHEQVLVRVAAVGINPVDWKTRCGAGVAKQICGMPFILGWDIAGTVEQQGRRVTMFEPGDRVMGMVNFPSGGGGYAEFVVAPDTHLVKVPDNLSLREAAALPLVALTAWQALFDNAGVKSKDRVLVHAAAGGVGHVAVQLARWKGAHVIGTASPHNHEFARSLGCDEVYAYGGDEPWTRIEDVKAVIDTVGGETRALSLKRLSRNGTLVALVTGDSEAGLNSPTRVKKILVKPNQRQLEQIAGLLADGTLKVHTTVVNGLRNLAEAHSLSETRRVRGKIVVTL